MAVLLAACLAFGAGCSSQGGASSAKTVSSSALKIPPPFEVGQRVGLGDVTVDVVSFRRSGDALTVRARVFNPSLHALSLAAGTPFSVFYDTGLHAASHVSGLEQPIAPNAERVVTLDFTVPTQYAFPLLWFAGTAPGTHVGTIVLRGNGQ